MKEYQQLVDALNAGWVTSPNLQSLMGWSSAHSVRGAMSQLRRKNLAIERQRLEGVTSYRIAPEYDATKDIEGSFSDAYAAIRERKEAGGPGWEPK